METDMTDSERMTKLIATSKKNWGDATHTEGGVTFYKVGRNSSHDFYVGQVGFAFLVYSVGEDYMDGDRHICAYQSFDHLVSSAYLGHL
jgi:hypothetical protein